MANADIVYNRALQGTLNNPGLPDTLAQLVVGQSQDESANFTSPVFAATNNGFGYKYSGSSYQHGDYEGYAKYDNLDDSTAEVVDYIYRRVADGSFPQDLTTITTPDQYATLLANAKPGPYYGVPEQQYASGIASYFQTNVLQPLQENPSLGVLILVGIAFVGYLIAKRK
jgi:uncharacterized FlgJ-related protein